MSATEPRPDRSRSRSTETNESPHTLLAKFAWPGEAPVARLRGALPGATLARLLLLQVIDGASARQPAPYHYVVETDVRPESEADLNDWYEREHLPGLAAVQGTVRAMRFRNLHGSRYNACYDLARPGTPGSPAWLSVRGSPCSDRVRPAFYNATRTMFRRV